MAREYASIKLTIWSDDDWRDLTPLAKLLYLSLLTSPTLSHCGVADWRPARIAVKTGMTTEEVEDCGAEMVDSLHLVIDEDSEEVLVRSFVRHDGLMKQPKMATAMATAHSAIASGVIRGVVVHELNRLKLSHPNLNGWGSEKASDLLGRGSVDPSTYPLGKGSVKGMSTPLSKGSEKGSPTPAPTTTPNNSHLQSKSTAIAASVFEDFWAIYPRKEGKGAARKALPKALKIVEADELLAVVRSFAVRMAGTEPRFIPFPATWLNQERWADEVSDQKAEAAGEWFQPFTLPECPPDIADDPERYAAWVQQQRDAWRQEGER